MRTKKNWRTALYIIAVALLLFAVIGVADLNMRVTKLESAVHYHVGQAMQ